MTQAIFLSYASQDADAARRICEALRAAGLEVWFDQSELRGGDAWDASIRKQIKECSLFVPIISDNTNAREEGYFRLEWKLAVDRSHLMADDKSFFFPVILGDVAEPTARVPDKFRERQWTRLGTQMRDDGPIQAFAERIGKLASGGGASSKSSSMAKGHADSPSIGEFPNSGAAPPNAPADATPSIAVLAFANRSASADDEYFSDGLADELLNVLAKIKGLRVAARTSAFSFKGKQTTVKEIGKVLNVATVLEGSVRKSGNRVRISVQLVKAQDGFQLWSETYDRALDDIFAVQDDIAHAVVTELREKLLGETTSPSKIANEIGSATTQRTENAEALRLLLQARFFMDKRRPDDIARAIGMCLQAIAIDVDYADAHAVLAHAYLLAALYGRAALMRQSGDEVLARMREARVAAEEALRLNPQHPRPYLVLSWIVWTGDHDAVASVKYLDTALSLAPDNAEVLRNVAHRAMELGDHARAEALFAKAVSLDPLSAQLALNFAMGALYRWDIDLAYQRALRVLEINEGYWAGHVLLHIVLREMKEFEGSARAFIRATELRGNADGARYLQDCFARGAWTGFLEGLVARPEHSMTALDIALAYLALDRLDDAYAWLNRVVDERTQMSGRLKCDPALRPLHGDARYAALLKRAGFPE